jgi:hypothetical protein
VRLPIKAAVCAMLLAAACAGAEETVSGTVRVAGADGSVVRLNFDDPGAPQVILLIGWASNFPPAPEQYYLGKTLSVRGSPRMFRGRPEIHVRDAGDIVVLSAASPAAGPTPVAPGEVEMLREQVRTLEQRVKELERRPHEAGERDE